MPVPSVSVMKHLCGAEVFLYKTIPASLDLRRTVKATPVGFDGKGLDSVWQHLALVKMPKKQHRRLAQFQSARRCGTPYDYFFFCTSVNILAACVGVRYSSSICDSKQTYNNVNSISGKIVMPKHTGWSWYSYIPTLRFLEPVHCSRQKYKPQQYGYSVKSDFVFLKLALLTHRPHPTSFSFFLSRSWGQLTSASAIDTWKSTLDLQGWGLASFLSEVKGLLNWSRINNDTASVWRKDKEAVTYALCGFMQSSLPSAGRMQQGQQRKQQTALWSV